MEYLLKASVVIFIFYCSYKLFLQRETFFQTNRWFLLLGIIVATIIPFVVIPIYIEYIPATIENFTATNTNITNAQIDNVPAFDLWQLVYYSYLVGVIFFLGKLCLELTSLNFLFNKHEYYKQDSFTLIETNDDIPPFSFFNWIVYNPNNYSKDELNHILNHEKVHAKELHSIDIVLTQLACILLWFNPFIWFYKKEIQQNLEFIADKKAQDFSDCEKSYQLVLLKSSIPQHKFLMTNNFYNSQIKTRIIMLHKSKSNKLKAWKYALILPVLALFLMSFNTEKIFIEIDALPANAEHLIQPQASTQLNTFTEDISNDEKPKPTKFVKTTSVNKPSKKNNTIAKPIKSKKNSQIKGDISLTLITKQTSDTELEKIKEKLKKEGLNVKFKGIKRNNSGEITAIKIEAKSKKSSSSYSINSDDETIEPIKIVFDSENNSISIGNGHAKHGENTFVFESKDGNHQILKSGSGSNVFVISDDEQEHDDKHEHDGKFIIKSKSSVHVISGDNDNDNDNEVIEILIDKNDDNKETIIVNGKKVNLVEGKKNIVVNGKKVNIVKGNGENVWINDDDNEEDVIILQNANNKNNIFFSSDDNEKPLVIVDGKEITKDQMKDIKPDMIESVTVLKDKKATEKYGKKGENGVIIIKLKKKN